ncbi:MAG TPA: hypothetical protein VD757_02710 [Candidatus Nitrosocosmicus sp.]|nr:hypothetical protein [Candidatus Nitrosocosmicus sp.]
MRILKNYRLPEETVKKLEQLQDESGKTATDIIEGLIKYLHEEVAAARSGEEHDEMIVAQVLGKKVKRRESLVKTAS